MEDFLKLISAVVNAEKLVHSYEERCVGRDPVDGVVVSTAFTDDCGYETAILTKTNTRIVERYASREAAVSGHAKWIRGIVGKKTLTDVGYGSSIGKVKYPVERMTKKELAEKMEGFGKLVTKGGKK